MTHEITVPEVGESVQEVQVGRWLVEPGTWVAKDTEVVEIETDKASLEVFAPVDGTITEVLKKQGDAAEVGDVIARFEESKKPADKGKSPDKAEKAKTSTPEADGESPSQPENAKPVLAMPAAERLLAEHGLSPQDIEATGPGGRLLKEDVLRYLDRPKQGNATAKNSSAPESAAAADSGREEEVVPMSLIRRRIAERLVQAQQEAALLTTVNEIDMTEVVQLRKTYRETFKEKFGIKLGFMSFFVKAAVEALKEFPNVNASIRGTDIVFRNYYDVGIAIGGGKGLVVPVLRDAQRMSFADIELAIDDFAQRAQNNKIKPHELQGGTFTISNGGVYGSLLSTPIVNPPQSGVLGLHAIEDRPVARDGAVVIRPMMYVALSYDHRIIDGRESVTFLRRIKEIIEQPSRMLLEV